MTWQVATGPDDGAEPAPDERDHATEASQSGPLIENPADAQDDGKNRFLISYNSDDDGGLVNGERSETRGQVMQRHKRELKTLKEHAKRAGKKAKDEFKVLERDMLARHEAELMCADGGEEQALPDIATLSVSAEDEQPAKLSKAQKRRQRQLEQEAERTAAIEEEIMNMGETSRMVEERALSQLLEPRGLRIHDIPADGNCMYRALAHQCELHGLQELVDNETSLTSHQVLRRKAAKHIREHPDEYMPFVMDDSDVQPAEQLKKYCQDVESTAAWGTQVELQALAAALSVHVQVFSVAIPVVDIGAACKQDGRPPLQVCYHQHAYGSGEHYNSVVPI